MHYLMEKRTECDYSDPFELLKNMNDVIMAYEPIVKKVIVDNVVEEVVDSTK